MVRWQVRRSQALSFFSRLGPCLIGMDTGSGAHHRARELASLGHEVRLMPAAQVKPCVKRGKADRVDADAICEGLKPLAQRSIDPVDRWKAQDDAAEDAARSGEARQAAGGMSRSQDPRRPDPAAD
ncbi:MAG: hypothetical protein AAGA32_21605 [Pseudomonadota bacterium]